LSHLPSPRGSQSEVGGVQACLLFRCQNRDISKSFAITRQRAGPVRPLKNQAVCRLRVSSCLLTTHAKLFGRHLPQAASPGYPSARLCANKIIIL
jgi:hypothetical protein